MRDARGYRVRHGSRRLALGLLLAVLVIAGSGLFVAVPRSAIASTPTSAVTGTVKGPTYLGYNDHGTYVVTGKGGPAVAPNGTQIGNLSFYVSFSAANTSGLTASPASALLINGTFNTTIYVSNISEIVTLIVEIDSVYLTQNVTTNLTYPVQVVQPYVVAGTLIVGPDQGIIGFPLQVSLDGRAVGQVVIPSLTPNQTYAFSYSYVTLGLSPGWHTFSVSLANEHGLVTFGNGATMYSQAFYIAGPPPNDTLYYVLGAVAFFGAIFIFLSRVAARRRGRARK